MNEWNLNVMLIIAAIAVLIKMVDGYRKGMVKEVISLVSLVVLSVVAALLAYGVPDELSDSAYVHHHHERIERPQHQDHFERPEHDAQQLVQEMHHRQLRGQLRL